MTNRIWLDLYPEEISKNVSYEEIPIQEYLTRAYEIAPEQTAIHFMGKDISYKEFYESSLKFANYLRAIGIEKGDRVAIMMPNCPQSAIAFYGTLYSGAIVVQTNPLYTERELKYQLVNSGAKVIVALDLLFPRINRIVKETALEHIIVTSIKDYLPFPKNFIYPFMQKREQKISIKVQHRGMYHLFPEVMKVASSTPIRTDFNFNEDVALLQYTGGTTGPPKGVMLTHKNLVSNTAMCKQWLYKSEEEKEIVLGMLPFFHVYGMTTVLVLTVMMSNKMVLMPKPDMNQALKIIEKQRPTLFPGAPTMYIGLLNHPNIRKYDLSSITACISGSATLPVEVKERFERITGGKIVEGYGLTETSPVTHANFIWASSEHNEKGSIGVPWPSTDACILGPETSHPLAPGEVGEIAIKGPQVMKSYWEMPEATERSFRDGWLLTGDLGYMDKKGRFYIVDRKKDMIIASGFNIYPREVEEVLYEHESILECVVVGVPDPYRGETVKAFIVLKDGESVTEEALDKHCRVHLASFKTPRIYEFRKELPKTAVGKILRRVLIEEEKGKGSNNLT